jgi:hypothetical protein
MGAQLWYHAAPWFPDPNEALLALQTQCLPDCFANPAEYIRNDLEWTRGLVQKHEAERDPYGLLDMYRRKVALLEDLARQGVPDDARQRIELVRQLCRLDGAEGVGNILDVLSTAQARGLRVAEVLTAAECRRLVGSARPTRQQAEAAVYRVHAELGRGECVCFPIFADKAAQDPAGWYFIGNTLD